jgi:hypothetical protein
MKELMNEELSAMAPTSAAVKAWLSKQDGVKLNSWQEALAFAHGNLREQRCVKEFHETAVDVLSHHHPERLTEIGEHAILMVEAKDRVIWWNCQIYELFESRGLEA